MDSSNDDSRHRNSRALFERASRVIPGGIYGHQTPQILTRDHFPFFLADGEGCRIRDVDAALDAAERGFAAVRAAF